MGIISMHRHMKDVAMVPNTEKLQPAFSLLDEDEKEV